MERNKQFDVLLVIGITYVVVGHCGGFTLFQEWLLITYNIGCRFFYVRFC